MKKSQSKSGESSRADSRVVPGDWRGELLSRLRALIMEADPEMTEERKWRKPSNPAGVPTWSHNGLVCTGETYKNVVKMTFAKGASLADPSGLFNSSLEGNTRRAIDFHEGDKLDEEALKALIRAAVALNTTSARGESSRQVRETLRHRRPTGWPPVRLDSERQSKLPTTRGSDPAWSEERVTPSSLMPLLTGKRGSSSTDTRLLEHGPPTRRRTTVRLG